MITIPPYFLKAEKNTYWTDAPRGNIHALSHGELVELVMELDRRFVQVYLSLIHI